MTMTMTDDLQTRVAALEARDVLLTQALRRLLEAKLEGADGAAADVVALEGGQTSIDVQLGKSSGA